VSARRADDRLPIERAELSPATAADAPELLVLQRCCWVDEALANDTLEIAALHESLDDVREWLASWAVWCVRLDGRLIGAVRAVRVESVWEIGRLMVAPDLAGKGLGRWLLRFAESKSPPGVETVALFTGAKSTRNIAMYERAGYAVAADGEAPPGAVHLRKRASAR
jgi:tRNA (guanine37-N1)-methyltransferase